MKLWLVEDWELVEIGDSPEPSLIAIYETTEEAEARITRDTAEPHPSASLGYRWQIRAREVTTGDVLEGE